ncbi:MAG: ATPase [Prevotella sp.]|jgi:N-acetylglucosamine kinase-like BadF-type ATPase|nr:ATPase [Prevotella sp.]MBQ7427158.1 ATPase [Prevotella sp.]MBR0265601.1 ATPase [Prevotella sp.]
MILIADSGSTKTDWAIVTASHQPVVLTTQGINPIHQSREQIVQIIREEFMGRMGSHPDVQKLRSSSILTPDFPYAVYFYGSGVRPEMEQLMSSLLCELFPQASVVEAHSDLLGAARALCGRKEGIACILGTGANSCLYDGNGIVQHTPALGYILGDEGSGAALGKRFIHDLYCGVLSEDVLHAFEAETKLRLPEIINRVYRQPLANRFLASLSEFISGHLDDQGVHDVVVQNFTDFLRVHIAPYGRQELPVSFVGSVAFHYQDQLREAVAAIGRQSGTIIKTPLAGLIRYHQN